MSASPLSARIQRVQGDITRPLVAAVVHAANSSLLSGGGVVGAIHRAGGLGLLANCYRHSLRLADEIQLESVAFPDSSTGIYGYLKPAATAVAVHGVRQ